MSQQQPKRPRANQFPEQEPIRCGDVFDVSGELASKPVPPRDAATMQAAENIVLGQYTNPTVPVTTQAALDRDAIAIGEALEASALSAGDKPVDDSDAAAIQAAEIRASSRNEVMPGGVAATAQSAATLNQRTMCYDNKTKLSHVLGDATMKLPDDKPVTREDAERVIAAELRNNPKMSTTPGGVALAMAAAARFNQNE